MKGSGEVILSHAARERLSGDRRADQTLGGRVVADQPKQWDDYFVTPTPWGFGHAGALDGYSKDRDVVEELRKVVEEVTGKPVAKTKPRIGFLP